jgi:1,4-alpha-glucan branching enzyme
VAELWYNWGEQILMAERAKRNALAAPMAIYEIRLGSWRRVPEEGDRPLSYRELAPRLAEYVQRLGFTHVEFLPVMEPLLRLLGLRDHGLLCANQSLRHTAALYEGDCDPAGFAWVDCNDAESSVVRWLRQGISSRQSVLNVRHGKPDLTLRVDIFEQARAS